MKDITVALELTVDDDVADADVQYLVQKWLRKAILDSGSSRVCPDLIDVKAVASGSSLPVNSWWRVLDEKHGADY